MNNIYRVIWSALKQTYVAVNEKTGTAQSRGKSVKAVVTAALLTTALGAGAATVLDTGNAEFAYYEATYVKNFFDSYPTADKSKILTGDMEVNGITGSAKTLAIGDHLFRLVGPNIDLGNVTTIVSTSQNNNQGLRIGQAGSAEHTTLTKPIETLYLATRPRIQYPENKEIVEAIGGDDGYMAIENATVGINNFFVNGDVDIDAQSKVDVKTLSIVAQDNAMEIRNDGQLTVDSVVDPYRSGVAFIINDGTAKIKTLDALVITKNNNILNVDDMKVRGGNWSEATHTFQEYQVNTNDGQMNVSKTMEIVEKSSWGNGASQHGTFINQANGVLTVGTKNLTDGTFTDYGFFENRGDMTVNGAFNVGTTDKQYGIFVNTGNLTAATGTVYGQFQNRKTATFDKLDVLASGLHSADLPFSHVKDANSGNTGTITVREMNIAAQMSNDKNGQILAKKDSTSHLTVSVNDFSNGADALISGFQTMDVNGSNFLNFGRIENIGTLNVAGELDSGRPNDTQISSITAKTLDVKTGGKLHLTGNAQVDDLIVAGTVDEKSLTQDQSNKVAGQLTVKNSVTVNGGTLDVTNLSVGKLTLAQGGTGTVSVDNLTLTGTGSSFGTDATFQNLELAANSDLALTGGKVTTTGTTVGGTLTLGNGSLVAQNLAFSQGGALMVTGQGSTITNLTGANGKIDLAEGSKLTVNGGSLAGAHVVYNGTGDLAYTGKIEGATLEYKGVNKTFTGADQGFGANKVILDNSQVTFDGGAVLKNDATITLGANSKITADKIDFGTAGKGHLTMAGGTLTTNLGQIFNSVDATNKLPAVDENGNAVEVPMSGITSVGSVKDTIKNGVTYESGTFDFTDNGWTNMAVDSAVSNLGTAFGSGISKTTVVFSGKADEKAKFDVAFIEGIQNNTNGLIFSDKVLDATGKTTLTFGNAGIKGNFGFKGIDTVESVTVADGQKLYLVGGTEGTYSTNKLLSGSQAGGTVDATTGTLVLGMTGKTTHGMIDTVKGTVNVDGGEFLVNKLDTLKAAQVASGATLHVGSLTNAETGSLVVAKDGTLKLESTTAQIVGTLNNTGSTEAKGDLTVKTAFTNEGTFTGTALTVEDQAQNNGQMTLTGALTSNKNFVNTNKVDAQSATLAGLTNSGTMTLTGNLSLGDLGLTQTTGSITAANVVTTATKDATFDIQGGKLVAQNVTLNATQGVQTLKVAKDASVEATGDLTVDVLDAQGQVTANSVKADTVTVANTMTLKGALEATKGLTLNDVANVTALSAKAETLDVNAGTLKVTEDVTVAKTFTNKGTVTAKNLTAEAVNLTSGSLALTGNLTAKNGVTLTAGTLNAVDVAAKDVTVNGGELTATNVNASNALTIADKAVVKAGNATFNTLKNAGTLEFTKTTDYTITDPATFTNEKTGVIKGLKSLTVNANGTNAGTVELAQGGKLAVGENFTFTNSGTVSNVETLDVNGKIVNNGNLAVTGKTTMGQLGAIEQSADAVFATKDLEVQGNAFKGMAGTLKVENGLTFANDATVSFDANAKEMVFGTENLNGQTKMTYNVDNGKILTFGKEHGLVDTLAKVEPSLAKANGTLVIGKSITMGANGTINVGSAPAVVAAGTPANLNAVSGSLTVVDASALTGNTAITGEGATAKVDQGAKVAITRVTKDGDIMLLKGFQYDATTVDADGKWIGGWTGADAIYVNDGSGLDYEVTTKLDANKNFVATIEMADVSTVYTDLAIKDIANAALKRGQKGGEVTLIQNVIRNDKLTVAEKTQIINSVAQMGATLGTAANFFADTTTLMGRVEDRASLGAQEQLGSGLWVNVEGGKFQQDGLKLAGNMEAGYDTNTYGFTFGADTQVQPNLRLGGAISYLDGSADAKGDALSATNDDQTFGIQGYGAYDLNDTMRLVGTVGWFHSKNDMTQTIARADVAKAEAESHADAFTMSLRAEKAYAVNGFALTPYAGLRAVYMVNDDYTTKVDGAEAFKNDQSNTFTVQMPIGVAVSKAFDTASGWTLEPIVDVAVVSQFGDTDYDTIVTGVGTGVAQTLNADMAGSVLGQAKFGLRAINKQTEFSASYGLTAGDAGRQDHAFTLGVSYKF